MPFGCSSNRWSPVTLERAEVFRSLSMRLFPDSSNSSKRQKIFFCSSNIFDKESRISIARLSFDVVDAADAPLLVVHLFVFVEREV